MNNKKSVFILLLSFLYYFMPLAHSQNTSPQQRTTGVVIDDLEMETYRTLPVLLSRDGHKPLTHQVYSLRPYCPTPQSQGDYATCTIWTMNYFLSIRNAIRNNWYKQVKRINKNNYNIEVPYLELKERDDKFCNKGLRPTEVLTYWQRHGIHKAEEISDRQFDCSIPPNIDAESALLNRIQTFKKISGLKDSLQIKMNDIKYELIEYKPVIAVLQAPPSLHNLENKVWLPDELPSKFYKNHAVTIIGYDDDYIVKGSKMRGAFEILNSWGTDWGNKGFAWIPYEVFTERATMIFKVSDYNLWGHIDVHLTAQASPSPNFHFDEKNQAYTMSLPKRKEHNFDLKLQDQNGAFTYIFNLKDNGQLKLLYPSSSEPPRLQMYNEANINLTIKPKKRQEDYLIVLYSNKQLDKGKFEQLANVELDAESKKLSKKSSKRKFLAHLLKKTFDMPLIEKNDIRYTTANEQIYFEGYHEESSSPIIIPVIIKIDYNNELSEHR